MAGVGSFETSTPVSSAPLIQVSSTPPSHIAPIMSDSPSPIAHTSISLEKLRRTSLVDKVRNMKLPALRSMAKERGLKRYSKLKKADLVALLLEGGDDVDPIPNESLETLLHAHSPLPSLLSPMSPLTLSLENSDRSNNYEPSELLMADVGSSAPFIPVLSTPPSPIAHVEQKSIRCTIEELVKSSLDAFINDADVCDGEETAVTLKQMLSCAETFKYLTNRLTGNAGMLFTPIGLLVSPLSEGGSKKWLSPTGYWSGWGCRRVRNWPTGTDVHTRRPTTKPFDWRRVKKWPSATGLLIQLRVQKGQKLTCGNLFPLR